MAKDHKQEAQKNGGSGDKESVLKRNWMPFVAGVAAAIVIAFVTGLVVVYTGAYNVAATEEHRSFVRWAFDTNYRRSVQNAAADTVVPANITPAMIESGGQIYSQTCVTCHATPDGERASWASGMRPVPPHLRDAATEWEINEVFWLAKHGVRMTGMPAFGSVYGDEDLWGVAAFVKKLPAMTPEEYARETSRSPLAINQE